MTKTLFASQKYQDGVAEQTRVVRGYTRPDAMQNLRTAGLNPPKGGGLYGAKNTPRTLQGPVPPQLADKSFDQGARSYEEAVMAGTTKFVDEAGIPTQIRNYGSDTAPHGRTTKVEVRKTSGRGKTSEGDRRKINEMLATDPTLTPAEKQAFSRIMAQAAAEGMDGDHIVEIARVANAVRDMTPAQRKAYFKRFKKAGVALGNDPKNVQKLSKRENQVVKPAQLRAIDKAIPMTDVLTSLQEDFKLFLQALWDQLDLPQPTRAQYAIADYLQHGPKRLQIQAFRGVGKSWITGAFVLWTLFKNPEKKIMIISASKERADNMSIFLQKLIIETPWLKHLQPKSEDSRWSRISFDVNCSPHQAPSVKSVGITGQLTGSRADLMI